MAVKKKPAGLVDPAGHPIATLGDLDQEDRQKALDAFERVDDQTITQQLNGLGGIAKFLLYELKFEGKTGTRYVIDLSINGVREIGDKVYPAGFRVEPMVPGAKLFEVVDYDVPALGGKSKSTRFAQAGVKLISVAGGKEGVGTALHKMMDERTTKDDVEYEVFNPNFAQIAISGAERKALSNLLAPSVRFKWLYKWYGMKNQILQIDEATGSQKQIGTASKMSVREMWRRKIFKVCEQAGMDTNEENKVILAHVERTLEKKLSAAKDEEIQRIADVLETTLAKKGGEETCRIVRGE